jgi:hypothetical protein
MLVMRLHGALGRRRPLRRLHKQVGMRKHAPDLYEITRRVAQLRPCWTRPEAFFEARSDVVHDRGSRGPMTGLAGSRGLQRLRFRALATASSRSSCRPCEPAVT